MLHFLLRRLSPFVCLGAILLMNAPLDSLAQVVGKGKGNARVMDLSLQYDTTTSRIVCLGDPNTLHVAPGDWLTLKANGTLVNDVKWDSTDVPFNKSTKKHKKELLSDDKALKSSGPFTLGTAFTFKINKAIKDTTQYELKVTCANLPDDPPKIIVDP